MTNKRCMELLNSIIYHVTCSRNTEESVHELILMGFTAEELVEEFDFDEDDVSEGTKEFEDDVIYTFGDLQSCFDFDTPYNLLHAKGSDWEIEVSTFGGKNIKLYRRYFENGNFIKKLEIFFKDDGTVRLFPANCHVGKPDDNNTNLLHKSWYEDLFKNPDLGRECAEFLNEFTKALKTI